MSFDIKQVKLPDSPGVYLYKDNQGKVIYVGKAANLRSRVASYWQKSASLSPAKYSMLKQVDDLELIETDSEIEALLLEANLIKKYQPQYNVVMRDDKRYIYIKISTEEEWPRIFLARNLDKSGTYFGPFVSTEAVKETLKVIRRIWPYRSCVNLPKRVCLYYQIAKCPGMCEKKADKKEYQKIIRQIIAFLEGGQKKVLTELKKDLKATNLEEERKISEYRIANLKRVLEHTKILSLADKYAADVVELGKVLNLKKVPERIEGYDISNVFGREAVGSMVVFKEGEPDKKEYRRFKIKLEDTIVPGTSRGDVQMLEEMLTRRFKHSKESDSNKKAWPLPDLIIIDGAKAQLNVILRVLRKSKLDIPAIAISKGGGLRSARARDKIFFPKEKKPLELSLDSPALHLVKRVRDEAHRFAIEYHRLLRRKRVFGKKA